MTRTYNAFCRAGFKQIKKLEGKNIYDLVNVRNAGVVSIAIIIIILNHYNVLINLPNREEIEQKVDLDSKMRTKIYKVYDELPKVEKLLRFK